MSHGLEERNGHIEAAFAGQVPWHGLGTLLKDRMTPTEALEAAHLDWQVDKLPISAHDNSNLINVPGYYATVRRDTQEAFGVVGPQYTVLQNKEQADFIETLVGNGCVVECVGALFGGSKVFWTVKSPQDMIVNDSRFEDRVKKYLILYNDHAGRGSFRAFWNPTRVVCNNTLKVALGDTKDGISIRHTQSIKARMQEAKRVLGLTKQFYENANMVFDAMASKEMKRQDLTSYLDKIYGSEIDDEGKKVKKVADEKSTFGANLEAELAATGKSTVTLWDAFNAITYATSHQIDGRRTTRLQNDGDRKFETVLFGKGDKVRQRAYKSALTLLAS